MKKLTVICLTILFCLTSNVAWSTYFQKEVEAYDKGDYATALREWRPLAKQGSATARNIAASNGDTDGLKRRDMITNKMTPSQIAETQKIARECVRKKYKGC